MINWKLVSFVAILVWNIWKVRSTTRFDKSSYAMSKVLSSSCKLWNESKATLNFTREGDFVTLSPFWSSPSVGCTKVNFGASFLPSF